MSAIQIDITNEQTRLAIDEPRLREAILAVLAGQGVTRGAISVAVVDDPAIHALNVRYLQHDYATDVLSFVLEEGDGYVEGEVIVSADTAIAGSTRFGWQPMDELLLYAVHGTLHLTGLDDHSPEEIAEMRALEVRYLAPFGLVPPWRDAEQPSAATAPSGVIAAGPVAEGPAL